MRASTKKPLSHAAVTEPASRLAVLCHMGAGLFKKQLPFYGF
jgi:hypothetical protein